MAAANARPLSILLLLAQGCTTFPPLGPEPPRGAAAGPLESRVVSVTAEKARPGPGRAAPILLSAELRGEAVAEVRLVFIEAPWVIPLKEQSRTGARSRWAGVITPDMLRKLAPGDAVERVYHARVVARGFAGGVSFGDVEFSLRLTERDAELSNV